MTMRPAPTPTLAAVQAALALGIFIELFDHPALVRQTDQALPGHIGGEGAEAVTLRTIMVQVV